MFKKAKYRIFFLLISLNKYYKYIFLKMYLILLPLLKILTVIATWAYTCYEYVIILVKCL